MTALYIKPSLILVILQVACAATRIIENIVKRQPLIFCDHLQAFMPDCIAKLRLSRYS